MKNRFALGLAAILASALLPAVASAYVLDTGLPTGSGFPLSLDGIDSVAAEFSLGAGTTITSIQGYITGGDTGAAGDTFTVALYSASGAGGLPGRDAIWSGQATWQADGWNGLSGLNLAGLGAGNYWVAFEVGASDSTLGLLAPSPVSGGTANALGYAFNAGGGYEQMSQSFGVQVSGTQVSAVPLPAAVWLLVTGFAGLAGMRRRKAA